jgi:hypothetical protein
MDIDCSVPCPVFIKMLNSCPSKPINLFDLNIETYFEVLMVLLSMSPYFISFILLLSASYYKTTRSVFLFIMIFGQNFVIEVIKGVLRDPRPNHKCNQQFGNPSNHATFYSSLITWILMELIMLKSKYRLDGTKIKLSLFIVYPFILYSRIYLNYHSFEQV